MPYSKLKSKSKNTYTRSFILDLGKQKYDLPENIKQKLIDIKNNMVDNFFKLNKPYNKFNKTKNTRYNKQKASYSKKPVLVNNWRNYRNEEAQDISKKIKLELNKLSGVNFKSISENILKLLDNSDNHLGLCIDLLFERALAQIIFCEFYAKLAHFLNQTKEFSGKIYKILLNKCKEVYGMSKKSLSKYDEKNYSSYCDYIACKKKFIGNFQLIGELYKIEMISIVVINKYWGLLVNNIENDDEIEIRDNYSECMCKLLETIGYKLLKNIGEEKFEKDIMSKVKEYSKDKVKFKARIRFLFMDCLDKKKWQK